MNDKHKQLWSELTEIHAKYLQWCDVKLPQTDSNKAIWLVVLYEAYKRNTDEWVSKDTIADVVRQYKPDASGDQQIRHLKRDGWLLQTKQIGGISHHVLDPYSVEEDYFENLSKRQNLLEAQDFATIKQAWDNRCASCGTRENEKSWRNYDAVVKLQQGHRDPHKPLTLENIIPQCQYCNRGYKGDFVFDEKGRVRAVASINPIKRASLSVKRKIKDFLNQKGI